MYPKTFGDSMFTRQTLKINHLIIRNVSKINPIFRTTIYKIDIGEKDKNYVYRIEILYCKSTVQFPVVHVPVYGILYGVKTFTWALERCQTLLRPNKKICLFPLSD